MQVSFKASTVCRYSLFLFFATLIVLIHSVSSVKASQINFEGNTSAVFVNGLSFTGVTDMDWTTDASGYAKIKLGTLGWDMKTTIKTGSSQPKNDVVKINISFDDILTTPLSVGFTADIFAEKGWFWNYGDVWFDTANATHITYSTDKGVGSFDLGLYYQYEVGDARLYNGKIWYSITDGTADIYGQISNASFTPNPVTTTPEPATILLMGIGGAGAALLRRRANRS